MKIGLIGNGAIAGYARKMLEARGHTIGAILLRRNITDTINCVTSVDKLPSNLDLMIDCAGHSALISNGPDILSRGIDLITVSVGALANPQTYATLKKSAKKILDMINQTQYKFYKRAKENGELYGSLKPIELSNSIEEAHKVKIKPSQIDLASEIKKIGSYSANINLHAEIQAKILIEVVKQEDEN